MPTWAFTINDAWFLFVTQGPWWQHVAAFLPLGLLAGWHCARWSARLIGRESGSARRLTWPAHGAIVLTTAALYPALILAIIHGECQSLVEGGSIDFAQWRILYYDVLLVLLIAATAIDLDQYLIPDEITVTGMLLGVLGAFAIAHAHLIPVWIDWNQADPITGPHIPQWIKDHPYWHALAWSLAGLVCGAGLTWLARLVSHFVLGVEALGFGDVTLMGMIGSFLGWQPVLFVFLLAPMCGLVIGLVWKLLSGRRALPYGPYLSLATLIVLFTWKWLWIPTRDPFGHWPTLAAFGALLAIGLAALLGLLRLYRSIPVTRREPP